MTKNYIENRNYRVGFFEAVKRLFARWSDFSGRSTRSEFWWAQLFLLLMNFALGLISLGILSIVVTLVSIIVESSLTFRRLHDVGCSGSIFGGVIVLMLCGSFLSATMLAPIGFICVVVGLGLKIVMFFLLFRDSEKGRNRYGDSEKYPSAEAYVDI